MKTLPAIGKIRDEAKDAFLAALDQVDGRYTDALTLAVVSDHQVALWKRDDPDFRRALELAGERRQDKTRRVVHEMIDEKEPAIVARAMSALPEFVKRSSVEVKGTVEHSHHVDNLPRAKLEELIDLGKQAVELDRADAIARAMSALPEVGKQAIELERAEDGSYGGE